MRIVFCGTPEFAVPALRALLENPEFSLEAVVTQPDRPRGRGQRVSASAVKEVAARSGRADLSAGKHQVGRGAGFFRADQARRGGDHRLRADHSQAPAGDSAAGLDEPACFAAAQIPRRGAHRLGDYQRRKDDRTYDDAARSGTGHRADPFAARNGNWRRRDGAGTCRGAWPNWARRW